VPALQRAAGAISRTIAGSEAERLAAGAARPADLVAS
jgi:hypothetical protein